MLYWSYCSEIWQASWQCCCQDACQISEQLEMFQPESHVFETSRDLAVRHRSAYWIGAWWSTHGWRYQDIEMLPISLTYCAWNLLAKGQKYGASMSSLSLDQWWSVNIDSGNGLVPSGNKPLPEPMLTQICCHMVSLGHNELRFTCIQRPVMPQNFSFISYFF